MHFSFKHLFFYFAIPLLSLIICLPSQAQHRSGGMNADGNVLGGSTAGSGGGGYITSDGWSVGVNGGYEMPLGTLKDGYKGAPTVGLTLSKKINHLIISGTVDYRAYQPKQSTFPIEVQFNEETFIAGEIRISDFTGVGAYLGAAYEWLITPSASFYAGLNGGYMVSKYTFTSETEEEISIASQTSSIPFVGPKLGLNFAVTSRLNIGIEGRYSFSVAKSKLEDSFDAPINPDYKVYSGNLFLTYNF